MKAPNLMAIPPEEVDDEIEDFDAEKVASEESSPSITSEIIEALLPSIRGEDV